MTHLCLLMFLPVNKRDALFVRAAPVFMKKPAPLCPVPASKLSVPTVNNKFIVPGLLQERKLLCMATIESEAEQWFLL